MSQLTAINVMPDKGRLLRGLCLSWLFVSHLEIPLHILILGIVFWVPQAFALPVKNSLFVDFLQGH